MEGNGKITPTRLPPADSERDAVQNSPFNQPAGAAAAPMPMGDGISSSESNGEAMRLPDTEQSAGPGPENKPFSMCLPPMAGDAGPKSDAPAADTPKAPPSAKAATGGPSGDSAMPEPLLPDQMPPGMMGMPGMPGFFPFPPVPMPGMPGFEGQGDKNSTIGGPKMPPFGGWMMDGMMSMGMMQNTTNSIDGSLMPAMPYAPGTSGMKASDGSAMPMMFFPPMMMEGLPDFAKDPSGKRLPPMNMMMPMMPMMDEKTALQSLSKLAPPQKTSLQKKASELDSMKSILTSVQIRETCQLKAWRRKLHKGRAQMKLDVEAAMTPSRRGSELCQEVKPVVEVAPHDVEPAEIQVKAVPTRQYGSMDMCWQHNRYRSADALTEEDMRSMRLFEAAAQDSELLTIRDALKRVDGLESNCYPYMFMDELRLPVRKGRASFRVWDDDDNDLSHGDDPNGVTLPGVRSVTPHADWIPAAETPKKAANRVSSPDQQERLQQQVDASAATAQAVDPAAADVAGMGATVDGPGSEPNADNNELELDLSDLERGSNASFDLDFEDAEVSAPVETPAPRTAEPGVGQSHADVRLGSFDELDNELLEGMSEESKSSLGALGDMDLDDEFEFDAADDGVAPPPAPPTYPLKASGVPDTSAAVDVSYTDDSDLFAEVPGTLSHYRAKICKLMNPGDIIHEWRGFKSRLNGPLLLADLVEFEHLWKVFQDRRVEDLCQVLGRSVNTNAAEQYPEQKGELLYRVGQAHMKLLLSYDSPEVQTLVHSSIYNLNAPNVIYTAVPDEEDITPNDAESVHQDAPEEVAPKEEEEETPAAADEETSKDDAALLSKENELRRTWRRRLQTLNKETRLALVNMGKSLRDIENVSSNVEQSRAYDAVVEFCEVAEQFRHRDYLNMLNQSFDDYYEKANPHESGKDSAGSNLRELLHTRIAKNLTGILPLGGKVAKYHNVRFHKPDFRAGLFSEHTRVQRGNYSVEWSSWPVRPLLRSNLAASYTEESGGSDDVRSHPSNYFLHSNDLRLNDDCKIALLEYVEQTPLLLPNCGMASRVDNYVNYKEDDDHKDVAFLGPLGTLCQGSDGIEMFGVKHMVAPGDGQAMLESTLYKAPIFVHPRPASEWHNKLNITTTDFLLTRSRSNSEVVIHLRPLTWQSGVAVYTVGQCEPKVDMHPPSSKGFMEATNDLLKAWVLKSVMAGAILDVKHLRKEARRKFGSLLTEKEIAHILKQVESTPIFSLRAQALERMIHSTIKPETVCALESVRAGRTRLATVGILHLKNPDNIAAVLAKVQDEERQYQQRMQSMDRRLRDLKNSYAKRLEAHGITGEKQENELGQFEFGLHVSLYGHLEERTLAPKIRFIKDMLDLTPWNISRDVKQVLNNRGASQFSLYGIGDPSGGRGEGINLLKRQAHVNVDPTYAGEDLRKLSMLELAKRLRCYGVAEAVIKTLPRWDQVALVRQYRDGFGGQGSAEGDHRWRIPPEEYQKKLNEILVRQRTALASDEPVVDDGETPRDNEPEPATDGIADALMEAFDEVSDKDDDLERRELDILRQLREAQSAGPLSEEERMAEVNKLKAVPGIMWLRQSRRTHTEPFGNERAVFIYGEENVRKLLRWRMRCGSTRKTCSTPDAAAAAAASKRICRVCGNVGHISSNPKCPMFKGERGRSGEYMGGRVGGSVGARKQSRYSDSSDAEITASVAALECDTTEWLRRNQELRQKRRLTYQASVDDSDDGMDSLDEGSLVNARRKQMRPNIEVGSVPVTALSSQMEQVMKLVSKAIRIVEKEPRFKPFTSRIPESVAPNYYKIIKHPMWLTLLKSKCKTRCYADLVQVLDDLALIELNCKQFNSETSPNAWLRKMSETLVDELLLRIQQLTSHVVSPSVIEEWAREHRANRIVAAPAPQADAAPTATPQVEII